MSTHLFACLTVLASFLEGKKKMDKYPNSPIKYPDTMDYIPLHPMIIVYIDIPSLFK